MAAARAEGAELLLGKVHADSRWASPAAERWERERPGSPHGTSDKQAVYPRNPCQPVKPSAVPGTAVAW